MSSESLRAVLELILLLISNGKHDKRVAKDSAQFANISVYVSESDNIRETLRWVAAKQDYYVRFNATQILMVLLVNECEKMQFLIAHDCAMGVPSLMNLLSDERELIRNEALLLLIELAAHNQEIQKIVAFEGAFETLFAIAVSEEQRTNGRGTLVVHDCLLLIGSLLRGNVLNQNFFRETSCIPRIPPLLKLSAADQSVLSETKHRTLELTLELVSLLVTGNNSATPKNQSALARAGALQLLLALALGGVGSPPVRARALRALGGVLRGHQGNVARFDQTSVPLANAASRSNTEPAVVRLLRCVISVPATGERLAALAAFADYLYENVDDQLAIADSARWRANGADAPLGEASQVPPLPKRPSPGQLLAFVLLYRRGWLADPFKSWFAACALTHVVHENREAKMLLLEQPLVAAASEIVGDGEPSVAERGGGDSLVLFLRRAIIESAGAPPRVVLGLLRVALAVAHNAPAVGAALLGYANGVNEPDEQRAVPALVALVSAGTVSSRAEKEDESASEQRRVHVRGAAALLLSLVLTLTAPSSAFAPSDNALRANLLSIVKHRLGSDQLIALLNAVSGSADFARAERAPTSAKESEQAADAAAQHLHFYDYSFVLLVKEIREEVEHQLRYPDHARRRPLVGEVASMQTTLTASSGAMQTQTAVVSHQPVASAPPIEPTRAANGHVAEQHGGQNGHASAPPAEEDETADLLASYVELLAIQRREIDTLREQVEKSGGAATPASIDHASTIGVLEGELDRTRDELAAARDQLVDARNSVDVLERRLNERNELLGVLEARLKLVDANGSPNDIERSEREAQLEARATEAQEKYEAIVEERLNDPTPLALAAARQDVAALRAALDQATSGGGGAEQAKRRMRQLERELAQRNTEYDSLVAEQDELLEEMTELEIENENWKNRIAAVEGTI